MSDKLHLSPDDDFPEDLSVVSNKDLQVLDSQVRHHDLDDEFQERDDR
jgi:hypothetical protein